MKEKPTYSKKEQLRVAENIKVDDYKNKLLKRDVDNILFNCKTYDFN